MNEIESPWVPCEYCDQDYRANKTLPADPRMFEAHIIYDCPNPDQFHRTLIMESPAVIKKHWPGWASPF